ncbi:clp protease adapter protein ClpF, chloroplastic [Ipomoea triloba]|uniref:clp protease adapter protein ClpF, chloroplastic n=1 Tax=Ipomoea triloba TaxID=35885 RepID=UPI00125DB402|nr:clp protease adapter protein ClpF, chloroplastic [Ipomoea triloba]XP_031101404.1 clp protease adapter protein ClpF, chloroplastic [Ipomoea triloba]
MVQGASPITVANSRYCGVCGATCGLRSYFGRFKGGSVVFGVESQYDWHQYRKRISFVRNIDIARGRNLRVEAGWLFKGGNQDSASIERSESANEDILMFFFQLDLATRVQYALNLEQYDIAKQLRDKLTEVESEVLKQQESKLGSASKSEVQDMAISILCLRADLQSAVESENYSLAADIRDQISKIEAESLAASVRAQAYENAQYAFRLGQRVKHKVFGYRGVICGMDPVCCESTSWMENAKIEKLSRGPDQPFYQVLVDVRADPNLLVTYVPEENLEAPSEEDTKRFDHPYTSFLFYGMDGAGDFIPIKQLREKYNKPRHELPYDPEDEKSGGDA